MSSESVKQRPLPAVRSSVPPFDERPGYLFRRCQQIAVAIFMDEAAEFDITPVQYGALSALCDQPGIDATRLSQLIAFDRSTLGSVLDRLETKGWIERQPKPDDKRVKLLYITEKGIALLQQVEAGVNRAQERMLAPLAPAERGLFMRMLARLVEENNSLSRAPSGPKD